MAIDEQIKQQQELIQDANARLAVLLHEKEQAGKSAGQRVAEDVIRAEATVITVADNYPYTRLIYEYGAQLDVKNVERIQKAIKVVADAALSEQAARDDFDAIAVTAQAATAMKQRAVELVRTHAAAYSATYHHDRAEVLNRIAGEIVKL